MRLPLQITSSFTSQLPLASTSSNEPPLLFIDSEPFIVELQGKLELAEGEAIEDGFGSSADDASRLRGSRVGKVDLSDPKKPTMRIAHHRLEGKLETLLTPYALLRTSKRRQPSSTETRAEEGEAEEDSNAERSSKRARLSEGRESLVVAGGNRRGHTSVEEEEEGESTQIEIVGIIRKKIVFNKRPEPLIEVSSEADPNSSAASKKEKEVKRGPKGFLGFGGGKR
ncbi:hypothetical protein JCM5350_000809 [Sporobolomyces pararoseus]